MIDLTSDYVHYVEFNNPTAKITFPAVFPNGEAPDTLLPVGTSINTIVEARKGGNTDAKESNDVTPTSPFGPEATMYGLRFDTARKTSLFNLIDSPFSHWTVSFWVKPTGTSDQNGTIISWGDGGNGTTYNIAINDNNTIRVNDRNGNVLTTTDTLNQLEWNNVVASCNGNDNLSISINGGTPATVAKQVILLDEQMIGGYAPSYPNTEYNGYLSDFYLVDGQQLSPTVFGTAYDGKWGPNNSTAVKAAITAGGGFGPTGYYLPFNPDAIGKEYISQVTSDPAGNTIYASQLFNGNPTSGGYFSPGGFGDLIWTPPGGLAFTTLRISAYVESGSNGIKYKLVGGTEQSLSFPGGPDYVWRDVPGSGTLEYIKANRNGGSNSNSIVGGFEVDGELLVDHNNIGVDDSGNNNDFYDQNFGVGNVSRNWSGGITYDSNAASFSSNQGPGYAFDGSDITSASMPYTGNDSTDGFTVNFDPGLTGNVQMSVFARSGRYYSVNGSSRVQIPGSDQVTVDVGDFTSGTPLTSIKLTSSSSQGVSLYWIDNDGVRLVDKQSQDTVLDTPMLSYAVLTAGENGNLYATDGTHGPTYTGEPGTKYYYEAMSSASTKLWGLIWDPTGALEQEGRIPYDKWTYNFGQQPFAYDYNNSWNWSSDVTASTGVPGPNERFKLFDGDLQTGCSASAISQDVTFNANQLGTPLTYTESVEVYALQSNRFSASVDGSSAATGIDVEPTTWTQILGPANAGTISAITCTTGFPGGGALNEWAAIKVDGKILTDILAPRALAYPNQLKQTWAEWNFGELDVSSAADRAIWRGIRTKLLAYPGQRTSFKSALIAKIATLNLTETEKALLRNRIFRQTLS